MEGFVTKLNSFFEGLPEKLRRNKIAVISAFVLITVFLGYGMDRVVIDNRMDSFYKDGDPVKVEYEKFKKIFGGDEYVYIVYKAKDGDIFSDRSINALKNLHEDFANYRLKLKADEKSYLDHISEIKSLINVKIMESSNEKLYSRSFIGDRIPKNNSEREALRKKAINHPDYPHLFLSKNSVYGGILLRTDFNAKQVTDKNGELKDGAFDDNDSMEEIGEFTEAVDIANIELVKSDITEYALLVKDINTILDKYRDVLSFYPVGTPVIMDFFQKLLIQDLGKIMGLVLILIVAMLFILFRSLSAVLWPIVLIVTTIVWVVGIAGWSGVVMSMMLQIIIFLVLSVGVADSVHIMSGYLFFREKNYEHKEALRAVMKKSGLACFLTSFTTAVGLVSLLFVPIQPISVFGIFSAIGVIIAFIFTVFLMPLMLDLWNPVPKKGMEGKNHFAQKLIRKAENTGVNNPLKVVVIFAVFGIIFFIGLMNLKVDSDNISIMKEDLPIRKAYDLVDQYMGGTGNMEILVDLKKENAFKDPKVLLKIDKLQKYIKDLPKTKVVTTMSMVNVTKESYKALNNNDQTFYKIPEDKGVLSNVLFLFDNANPTDRRRLITDDYSQGRVGINSKNITSIEAKDFKSKVQNYIDLDFKDLEKNYPDMEIKLTGNAAMIAILLDYISWSQIKSFGLTLIVISIILLVVLGNYKAGAIAIIPNVFPILTTFGIMGFCGIPLDVDTLLIAPVIIGLAVDDTIHFLTHFKLEVQKSKDIKKAAISSIREAGQAIFFTSIILSAGFSMFVLSFHNGLSHFGIFSAIAIMTAFIADIYLLPALCKLCNLDFETSQDMSLKLNENRAI
ncbi:MAG: MMPL family transporter [Deltaproteobacteria bacterium]|nr:MMPL family transporter [Deltaproteobacteria bacterium]